MFRIHFLSAYRSIIKNREISFINIFGLVIGLTAFLFILHYIVFERSYDTFFPDYKNIYRINLKIGSEGKNTYYGAKTSRALYSVIRESTPDIMENGAAYFESCLIKYNDLVLTNQRVLWADDGFEKVFLFEILSGHIDFSKPLSGIITQSKAKRLFGNKNPLGEKIFVNEGMPVEITGVIKDIPVNTHLEGDIFISMLTFVHFGWIQQSGDWYNNSYWNYIRLKPGSSAGEVAKKINTRVHQIREGVSDDKRKEIYSLQPLPDLHYANDLEGEMGTTTDKHSLTNLMIVALLTLLIAWINYINLATAQSIKRGREIGLRRLIGASYLHLWFQSFFESFILNLVGVIISCMLYLTFLNDFSKLFNLPFNYNDVPEQFVLLSLLIVFISGILFSSIYHTLNLSGITYFNKTIKVHTGGFKKGLVIAQMVISMTLIGSSIFVYKQLAFMKNSNLGMSIENVVTLNGPASKNSDPARQQKFLNFRIELLHYPEFVSATANMFTPGQEPRYGFEIFKRVNFKTTSDLKFFVNNADDGLVKTFGMEILAGKNFSGNPDEDFKKVLVTESGTRILGFKSTEQAIGQMIYSNNDTNNKSEIIGVLGDIHNEGFHKAIYPVLYHTSHPVEFGFYSILLNSGKTDEVIEKLKTIWEKNYPTDPFQFFFADEFYNRQYISETRFSKFYTILTILSICISCLGLYGIVMFYLNRKRKEITIRRVNGAKISEIMYHINKSFVLWGIYAFILACPVIYFVISRWLQNYVYCTKISLWVFAITGFISILIALLTVSWQSWKAASGNPVDSIRYE